MIKGSIEARAFSSLAHGCLKTEPLKIKRGHIKKTLGSETEKLSEAIILDVVELHRELSEMFLNVTCSKAHYDKKLFAQACLNQHPNISEEVMDEIIGIAYYYFYLR